MTEETSEPKTQEPVPGEAPIPFGGSAAPPEPRPLVPVPVIAGVIFLVVLIGAVVWIARRPPTAPPQRPSPDSLAYLSKLALTDFHLSTADNMIGSSIVYLDGKVANNGDKTVKYLRVRLYFYDSMRQLVLREEQDIIPNGAAPLTSGDTRDFQLRFDRLPPSWNYQPPEFTLVALEFQ